MSTAWLGCLCVILPGAQVLRLKHPFVTHESGYRGLIESGELGSSDDDQGDSPPAYAIEHPTYLCRGADIIFPVGDLVTGEKALAASQ